MFFKISLIILVSFHHVHSIFFQVITDDVHSWAVCRLYLLLGRAAGMVAVSASAPANGGLVNLAREHQFNSPFPGLARWAGTRKLKPIWILLKQETVSDSGIIWAICKSAPRSRQITTPAPHHSVFYRPDALPVAQPTAPKHWRQRKLCLENYVCDIVTLDCDDASA